MQALVLASTLNMTEDQWLEARRVGIGGSDAAAILGMNKFKSPVGVYLDKIGQSPEEKMSSEAAYWGNTLEDIVAQEFSKRTGLKIRKRNAILQHPDHPFMIANVDRLIVGVDEGLECKTASEYLKQEWTEDQVPASYLIQCQHYMAVAGFQAWWIAVLIGGNKFQFKRIERDEEIISHLIEQEKNFWENHVLKLEPPMFDGSEASTKLLNTLYPISENNSEIELPDEADSLIEAIEQLKLEADQLDTKKTEYENQLKAMLGDVERGLASERVITWKSYETTRLDSKALKKDHPDLFEQYGKKSTARRFQIK